VKVKTYSNHYNIDGTKYDRVTGALGYFTPKPLVKWMMKKGSAEAEEISKLARTIGKRVDKIATAIVLNKSWKLTDKDHPAVNTCVEAFKRWMSEEQIVITDTQILCYDTDIRIAGTRDLSTVDTIIDIKCSNRINLSYWLQLAAYHHLAKLPNLTHIAVLRLDKLTGDYEYVRIPYNPLLWQQYLTLLSYYRYSNIYVNKDKGGETREVFNVANTEFERKFGVYAPAPTPNWTKFHDEI